MQVTVYDDLHMGGHVDVVLQFVNSPTEYSSGGVRPPSQRTFFNVCTTQNHAVSIA